MRGAHENLQSQVSRYRQEAQEETDLIIFVSEVLAQRSGIDKKLADTISAMMELSSLFRNQSECYEKISQFVQRIQPSQDLVALKSRKMFVQYHVETCANKLREVSERSLRKIILFCFPFIFLLHTLQLIEIMCANNMSLCSSRLWPRSSLEALTNKDSKGCTSLGADLGLHEASSVE